MIDTQFEINLEDTFEDTDIYALTNTSNPDIISIKEYREIFKDTFSSDKQIKKRLQYLESFFRNIIRIEIEKIVE